MIEVENKTSASEQPKIAALLAVKALYLKQAGDIMMYNVVDNTVIADYYVICSARSSTHIKALADEVCYRLELENIKELRVEGRDGGTWVLVDFGSVIVHIFSKEAREFYKLERLLNEETKEDLSDFLKNLDENN